MGLYRARQYDEVPPVSDPGWAACTASLLVFVNQTKAVTIDNIVIWGEANRITGPMIRHMLAWLSFKDLVHYNESMGVWTIGPTQQVIRQKMISW